MSDKLEVLTTTDIQIVLCQIVVLWKMYAYASDHLGVVPSKYSQTKLIFIEMPLRISITNISGGKNPYSPTLTHFQHLLSVNFGQKLLITTS